MYSTWLKDKFQDDTKDWTYFYVKKIDFERSFTRGFHQVANANFRQSTRRRLLVTSDSIIRRISDETFDGWRTMAECDYRKCEAWTKILNSETKEHETSHAVVYKTSV